MAFDFAAGIYVCFRLYITKIKMALKKTIFNSDWINPKINPKWAEIFEPVQSDPFKAKCNLCNKSFALSNMGKQSLISHEKGSTHNKLIGAKKNTTQLVSYFENKSVGVGDGNNNEEAESVDVIVKSNLEKNKKSENIFSMEKVIEAEIMYALHSVETHKTNNSVNKTIPLLKKMFADSEIAKKITLGSTKLSYIITFGLAQYFMEKLERNLVKCDHFVVCFDESLNKISQRGQMDIVIRFFDVDEGTVQTRYFKSVFMDNASADDILNHFKLVISSLPLNKLLQVSMDGPNVNGKFFGSLSEDENVNVLELGCCGLHVVHGALQTGHKAANWTVSETLRAFFWIFKDSPARRSNFRNITGQTKFPKRFCSTRWIESSGAALRALEIADDIKNMFWKNLRNCLILPLLKM